MKIVHCQNESIDMSLQPRDAEGWQNLIQSGSFPSRAMRMKEVTMFGETDKKGDGPFGSDHSVPFLLQLGKCQDGWWAENGQRDFFNFLQNPTQRETCSTWTLLLSNL